MKLLATWTVVIIIAVMLAACACSDGNRNTQTSTDSESQTNNAQLVELRQDAALNCGHESVNIFNGVVFDTVLQKLAIGRENRIQFRVLIRDNYEENLKSLYSIISATEIDTHPLTIVVSVDAYALGVNHVKIPAEIHLAKNEEQVSAIAYANSLPPAQKDSVYITTNIAEIISGRIYEVVVISPEPGEYEIGVDMQYRFSSMDDAPVEHIELPSGGGVIYEAQ